MKLHNLERNITETFITAIKQKLLVKHAHNVRRCKKSNLYSHKPVKEAVLEHTEQDKNMQLLCKLYVIKVSHYGISVVHVFHLWLYSTVTVFPWTKLDSACEKICFCENNTIKPCIIKSWYIIHEITFQHKHRPN